MIPGGHPKPYRPTVIYKYKRLHTYTCTLGKLEDEQLQEYRGCKCKSFSEATKNKNGVVAKLREGRRFQKLSGQYLYGWSAVQICTLRYITVVIA